jgi:hypothetical protein
MTSGQAARALRRRTRRTIPTVGLLALTAALTPAVAVAVAGIQPLSDGTTAEQALCVGTRLPIRTGKGGLAPYVDLTLEGKKGPFLIDYGAGASSIEHGVWNFAADDPRWQGPSTEVGTAIVLASFDLPGWTGQTIRFNNYDRNVSRTGLGLQHGVVGIDLISKQNVSFHYGDATDRHLIIGKFNEGCAGGDLSAKGFRRVAQSGHWEEGSSAPDGVFNGPVVHLELAAAATPEKRLKLEAWAQIDTGYEDDVRPLSIDINQAYLNKLASLGSSLVEGKPIRVRGCTGHSHSRRTFTTPGHVLRVENGAGSEVVRLKGFSFILKNADEGCGGIASSSDPAAQLGASFLAAFGTTLFMGTTKEVWIRPTPTRE